MGIIYCYTNKITGKKYIGQTIHPEQRKRNHKHEALNNKTDYYFHRSIRKYGLENFEYEILEENCEELTDKETYYIEKYNTLWPNGYNQILHQSLLNEEARRKSSETKKKQWLEKSDEEKQKILDTLKTANLGKKQTEYQKQKVALTNSKKFLIEHPDGHQEEVQNLRAFYRKHNVGNIWKPGMKSKGYKNIRELPNDYAKYHQ